MSIAIGAKKIIATPTLQAITSNRPKRKLPWFEREPYDDPAGAPGIGPLPHEYEIPLYVYISDLLIRG